MPTQMINRLPWHFFIGPDGVVRTSIDSDHATIRASLIRLGLADRLAR